MAMRGPRVVQLVAGGAVVAIAAFAIGLRDSMGFKGAPVEITSIVLCMTTSAVVAYVATRGWHWLPAPFLAGIAGVFTGGRLGPVGGVIGVVVGAAVVAAVLAQSHLELTAAERRT